MKECRKSTVTLSVESRVVTFLRVLRNMSLRGRGKCEREVNDTGSEGRDGVYTPCFKGILNFFFLRDEDWECNVASRRYYTFYTVNQ